MQWDGHYVKRISRLGALDRSSEIVERHDSGGPLWIGWSQSNVRSPAEQPGQTHMARTP